jgi:hypothetical protein
MVVTVWNAYIIMCISVPPECCPLTQFTEYTAATTYELLYS